MRIATLMLACVLSVGADARAAPAKQSPWTDYWHHWGYLLEVHAELYWQVMRAPKLRYRLEVLEVYPNGVWAEFALTNRAQKTVFLDKYSAVNPARNFLGFDGHDRKWQVPQFEGCILRGPPEEFIRVPPGDTIRIRERLSLLVDKPLEVVNPSPADKAGRPRELTYLIRNWYHVYHRLPEDKTLPWSNTWATGSGRVPVNWFDKPYPDDWPFQTRLFGEREKK